MTELEKKPQEAGRWCKTCAHLADFRDTKTGDEYKVCAFTPVRPWAYFFWHPGGAPFVGKRYYDPAWCVANPLSVPVDANINSDWTEVMDCPTWEAASRHVAAP